jgi:hypothetical protein
MLLTNGEKTNIINTLPKKAARGTFTHKNNLSTNVYKLLINKTAIPLHFKECKK